MTSTDANLNIGVFAFTKDMQAFETGVTRFNKALLRCLIDNLPSSNIFVYASPQNSVNYIILSKYHQNVQVHIIPIESAESIFPSNSFLKHLLILLFCLTRKSFLSRRLWRSRALKFFPHANTLDILLYTPYGLYTYIPSMAKFFYGVPVISAIHDIRDFLVETQFSFHKFVFRFATKCLIKDSDAVLVPSKFIQDTLTEKLKAENDKFIISFCVFDEDIQNDDKLGLMDLMERRVKIKYGLPARYLFYPSTIVETKNHRRLIESLGLLKHNGLNVNLVLCGTTSEGGLWDELCRLIKLRGLDKNINHLGYVTEEEKIGLYKGARALIMPSIGESFGLPIWEAFSIGCPVITSRAFDMNEQVDDAAILVDPYSIEDMANKIKVIWEDDAIRSVYAKRAKARFQTIDIRQFCYDWIDSIRRLTETRGRIKIS